MISEDFGYCKYLRYDKSCLTLETLNITKAVNGMTSLEVLRARHIADISSSEPSTRAAMAFISMF